MKEVISKEKCSGCMACLNICPKRAIVIETEKDGFSYPKIDENKCINCQKCKKVCPVINTKENATINKCFVGYSKNDIMKKKSSSGGMFPLLANYILSHDGIVIGAAFNENNKLYHIAITKKEEINKLAGSKYVQSEIGDIFKLVKDNVEQNKILFVGLPCQVAGLKAFLEKEFENLICIDLFCHGVPSPKLFENYIKELESSQSERLKEYNFRDNSTGWDNYSSTAEFEKSKITELHDNNDYMRLFLSDIALRKSCYNCNFKLGNKYSDISLGDFWGVKKYYPEMYNKKGVSAIILNTEKGEKIFKEIEKDCNYSRCKIEEIVDGNPSLRYSGKKPEKREEFFKKLGTINVKELANQYGIKKKGFITRVIIKMKVFIKNRKERCLIKK